MVYGARVSGEIQRLRVSLSRDIYVAFQTDAGYVQSALQTTPEAIYCEAESADSWSVLASVLTPERAASRGGLRRSGSCAEPFEDLSPRPVRRSRHRPGTA